MSGLIVITFNDIEQAGKALEALKKEASGGYLKIDDAAVIVKQESGKVEVKNQMDKGVKWGAVGGSLLGLMLAGLFFPVAGLVLGAIGGGLVGKSLDLGVDKKFVQEVTDALKPGMSALFVIGSGNQDVIAATFRPFEGKIYQTNLNPDAEKALKDALGKD
jgi:uncharacterized membrane protein